MTLKNIALAFASICVLSVSARAEDLMDELAGMDLATINDSAAAVEEFDLEGLDIDQLAENAGDETDAVEACFRRFGFRRGGWRHWGGGFGGYGRFGGCGFNHWGGCYSPLYCYRPIVRTCVAPCYPLVGHYWGCF